MDTDDDDDGNKEIDPVLRAAVVVALVALVDSGRGIPTLTVRGEKLEARRVRDLARAIDEGAVTLCRKT